MRSLRVPVLQEWPPRSNLALEAVQFVGTVGFVAQHHRSEAEGEPTTKRM
jgi:hypothetical protein